MSLRPFTIRHRLYTYGSPESGASGGHIVPLGAADAAANLPPHIVRGVDELLASITPDTATAAYAVQRFGASGESGSFLCLVTSHPSADGMGRQAPLNHARILHIDSSEAWLDIHALTELAVAFESGEVLRQGGSTDAIRDYLLDAEDSIQLTKWQAVTFEDVSQPLAQTVIEMCVAVYNRQEPVAVPLPPQSSLTALRNVAAAWSSLPMAIQRGASFSIDARRGTRVKLLFTMTGRDPRPKASEKIATLAAQYIGWVHDRPDDVPGMIVSPAIRDAVTFAKALERASEPRLIQSEERNMPKSKQPAEPARGDLDPAVVNLVNSQVAAAEESLREYIKKWMTATTERGAKGSHSPESGFAPAQPAALGTRVLLLPVIASAITGALAAIVVVLLMRPPSVSTRPANNDRPVTSTPAAPLSASSPDVTAAAPPSVLPIRADLLPGEDWAHRFQGLSDQDPQRLAAIVNAVAAGEGAFKGDTAKAFGAVRGELSSSKPLAAPSRKLLRVVLFQMLAQQIGGGDFKVDGKFESVPSSAVKSLRQQLALESKVGRADSNAANLEAETILRWAARENL